MANFKLACGMVALLTLGLTGCMMDDDRDTVPVDYSAQNSGTSASAAAMPQNKPVQKSYASKDPVQKSTPGPKRSAAPQLPVLQ